jgi:uncharacterized membrane protein YqjE
MIESQPGNTGVIEGVPPESTAVGTMTHLVAGILDDIQKLVHQQSEMLKVELHEDFRQFKRATEFGGLGIVLLTVGILGLLTALSNFLHEQFQLSMWVSWAITSGILMALGIALAAVSYTLLERFNPIPRKTLQTLRENLQWKTK